MSDLFICTNKQVGAQFPRIDKRIWICLCGEQLEMRRFDNADMTHTACGNCGENWWIDWEANTLNHGNQDEALAAFRMGGKEKSNEPHI